MADNRDSPRKKQKVEDVAQPSKTAGKFKVMGHLVLAMKRFQASLNPTYTFGKRTSDSGASEMQVHQTKVLVQPKSLSNIPSSVRTGSGRTTSGRTVSGRPTSAGKQHGYKGNLLFRPLPPVENEVV
eukprot:jgi/Chrzof1/10009/Cz04g23250.t1